MAINFENWTPEDIRRLFATTTGCFCLLILLMGVLYGVAKGWISVEILGTIKGAGGCAGFLGFGWIFYLVIKASIGKGDDKNGRRK